MVSGFLFSVMDGRIAALDYGTHKIGVAITDPLRITASPHTTIRYSSRAGLLEALTTFIQEYEINTLVVGVPYTLSGGESATTREAKDFIEWLTAEIPITIHALDERYTTRDAKNTLRQMGVKTGHNKERVDSMAATHLLRYYLDLQ